MNRRVSSYSKSLFHPFRWLAGLLGVLLFLGVGCQPENAPRQSTADAPRIEDEVSGADQTMSDSGVSNRSVNVDEPVETILLQSGGAARSRGDSGRSVDGVIRREVLPEMGKATGSYHLLSIGIDTYVDWPKLETARHGAESVARALTNEYAYFEPENVRVLLDNDATENNILAELRDLANTNRVGTADSIVIYYAGHGHLDDLTGEGSWIPWESDTEKTGAWIPNVRIKTIIAATPARHVFLISDSCFSGDFFRLRQRGNEQIPERGIEVIANQEVDRKFRMRSRSGLSSGSIEPVMDGGAEGHSVFTYFFLRALQGAREPFVLPQDLYYRVYNSVKASDAEQTPQFAPLSGTNGELGQFVLFRKGGTVVNRQLEEMRERNNRLEAQMIRITQEQEENARRQAEQEAELARLKEEIDRKSREMSESTGVSTATGSDEFSELVANYTQLNTIRANQAEQLQILKDREAKLKAEQERIERERRARELANMKAVFDVDYQAYTNLLANPFTQEEQKALLWKVIAKKHGVADLEELGPEPGELEWDGEKVVLAKRFVDAIEKKREEERLAKLAAEFKKKFGSRWPGFTISGLGIEMVGIDAGTFMMGNEGEGHQVTLTEAYWLGKYEVTQGQWEGLMGSNPSEFKNAGKNAPVEKVSWEDTQEFIKKLNARERAAGRLPGGYEYGLPTEAQWEYACRAGTSSRYYFGNDEGQLGNYAWYDCNSGSATHPVGQKKPNAFGLYDMSGNVWEWCEDWYGDYPTGPVTNPVGPSSGSNRVNRGGSWRSNAKFCRSAYRDGNSPSYRSIFIGFRLSLRSASVR